MPVPKILDEVEAAGMDEHLVVVAETMKKVKHGIAACFFRLVAGRQEDAITDGMAKDFTRQGEAIPAARGGHRMRRGERNEKQRRHCGEHGFIHTAGPQPDSAALLALPDKARRGGSR